MYPKLILFNLLFITIYYTLNYTEFYDYNQKNMFFYFANNITLSF